MAEKEIPHPEEFVVVGDAQADIWAAQAIGCPSVALLTGAAGLEGKEAMEEANPSAVFQDIIEFSEYLINF